jgi:benzil reductase ((S)-benzoin forming)
MNTVFYITGTSRGIGKSIAEIVITEENHYVFGISRTQTIIHSNYSHISTDLSNIESLHSFNLPIYKNAQKVVLINNSGMLGEVNSVGKISTESIIKTHILNAIAPTIISNLFLKTYSNNNVERIIINISSGAARYPIKNWGNYCASKASLDMLSKVIQIENESNNVKVFSVAPGIVDTQMQDEIRTKSQEAFPDIDQFIDYKNRNQLVSPENAARSIIRIAKHPEKFQDVLLDVRKL